LDSGWSREGAGKDSDIENGDEDEMREYNEGEKKTDRNINRAGWGKK